MSDPLLAQSAVDRLVATSYELVIEVNRPGSVQALKYEAEQYRHIASLQQPLPGEHSLH